jgi:hypothetical protein
VKVNSVVSLEHPRRDVSYHRASASSIQGEVDRGFFVECRSFDPGERFGEGCELYVGKRVVDELHTRAAASFSEMDHPTSECIEDRCSGRYSVGVAANQEEQLTGFDLVFAAGDRSVEEFALPLYRRSLEF